jgi:UDP-N-acetylglucosamine 2-epimerase
MISLHPETINGKNTSLSENLLKSLKKYNQYIQIFSYPNSDSESNIILKDIKKYVSYNDNAVLHQSYGRIDYLHLLKYSEIIIGNSSSGFVEAPYLETPTVNIGTRQKGRPTTDSIFNSSYSAASIISNINLALNYKNSRKNINYKGMGSVDKVMQILKTIKIDNIKNKSFVDIT